MNDAEPVKPVIIRKKRTPLRFAPFYLPLLAVYPLCFLYSVNAKDLQLNQLVLPAVIMLAITTAAFLLAFSIHSLRPRSSDDYAGILVRMDAAALMVAILLFAFYTFGAVHGAFKFISKDGIAPIPLVVAVMLLALVVDMQILRKPSIAVPATRPLNVFMIALYALTMFKIVPALIRSNDDAVYLRGLHPWVGGVKPAVAPDVYFIILDAYPAAHVIKDYFGYDNHAFVDALRASNFTVNDTARSNYSLTFVSLSATLNGRLVNDLVAHLRAERSTELPYRLIKYNAVIPYFQSMGYRVFTVNSGWGPTAHSPIADVNLDCAGLAEFEDLFLRPTALWPFLENKQSDYQSRICTLRKLAAVVLKPGPKFVFAHILMPHPPFVVDRQGHPMNNGQALRDLTSWEDKASFVQQLDYLNGRIITIVHRMQSSSPVPPIIIIQGDHGSATTGHWIAPSPRLLAERMAILDAVYAPGLNLTADSIRTPVNTFNILFDKLFQATTSRMPDGSWFSVYERPYVFFRGDSIVRAGSVNRGPLQRTNSAQTPAPASSAKPRATTATVGH